MSKQQKTPPNDNSKPECSVPPHPFFECSEGQATFIQCIDAIDRVGSMIALCDALKLDTDNGLTPKAAFGYYWVSVMTRETLSYVSDRMMVLDRQHKEKHQQQSEFLSALLTSLSTLGRDNRDRFLNSAAARMNLARSDLDKVIREETM